ALHLEGDVREPGLVVGEAAERADRDRHGRPHHLRRLEADLLAALLVDPHHPALVLVPGDRRQGHRADGTAARLLLLHRRVHGAGVVGDVAAGVAVTLVRDRAGGGGGEGGLPLDRAAAARHRPPHVRVLERRALLEPGLEALRHRTAEDVPAVLQARIRGGERDEEAAHLAERGARVVERAGGRQLVGGAGAGADAVGDVGGDGGQSARRGAQLLGEDASRRRDRLQTIVGQCGARLVVGDQGVLNRRQRGRRQLVGLKGGRRQLRWLAAGEGAAAAAER